MSLLLAAAVAAATPAPDLRTAIATEQLTIATWALFAVGVATFFAAIVAALYAIRAYRLEERPGLVFAEALIDVPSMRQVPAAVIIPRAQIEDGVHTVRFELHGMRPSDFEWVERQAPTKTFEVRNIGRSAVVEASVHMRAVVSEIQPVGGIAGGEVRTVQSIVEGFVRIASIAANETVLLPVLSGAGPSKVKVVGVTALTPMISEDRVKRRRLPFTSSEMLIHREEAIRRILLA
jgi:hypothetical protein